MACSLLEVWVTVIVGGSSIPGEAASFSQIRCYQCYRLGCYCVEVRTSAARTGLEKHSLAGHPIKAGANKMWGRERTEVLKP